MNTKIRAFTLLETMIVAALVAGLVAGLFAYAAKAKAETRRSAYVTDYRSWLQSIREAYSATGSYAGATAADLRLYAPTNWKTPTAVVTQIGGPIAPAPVVYLGNTGGAVQLTHTLLPKDDCGEVVFQLRDDLATITVNSTILKANTAATFTRTAADTACNAVSNTFVGVMN